MTQTLTEELQVEIDAIKGSRFIATAAPVRSDDSAKGFVRHIRERVPNATHHCAAWRIASPSVERAQDDGEPGGSAGRPILAQLQGRDIVDAVVVVTRFFGGTKLGVGGLVRAYGAATAAVLDAARLARRVDAQCLLLEHGYPDAGAVEHVLQSFGVDAENTYARVIQRLVEVPVLSVPRLTQALRDATAGRVLISCPPQGRAP